MILAKSVGNLEAQVRELIHDNNNRTQRDEAIAISLARLEHIPQQITQMDNRIDERLKKLELAKVERDTQAGIWSMILKSPAVGWAIGIITAAAAFLFSRNQP